MTSAIIVAAGRGTRMGTGTDKLFLEVHGKPIVAHTWTQFEHARCIDEIILVVREELQEVFRDLSKRFEFRKPWRLIVGGKERQDSVWNGLEALSPESELVAIQ